MDGALRAPAGSADNSTGTALPPPLVIGTGLLPWRQHPPNVGLGLAGLAHPIGMGLAGLAHSMGWVCACVDSVRGLGVGVACRMAPAPTPMRVDPIG